MPYVARYIKTDFNTVAVQYRDESADQINATWPPEHAETWGDISKEDFEKASGNIYWTGSNQYRWRYNATHKRLDENPDQRKKLTFSIGGTKVSAPVTLTVGAPDQEVTVTYEDAITQTVDLQLGGQPMRIDFTDGVGTIYIPREIPGKFKVESGQDYYVEEPFVGVVRTDRLKVV